MVPAERMTVDGYVELHAKSFYSFGVEHPTPTSCWRRRRNTAIPHLR